MRRPVVMREKISRGIEIRDTYVDRFASVDPRKEGAAICKLLRGLHGPHVEQTLILVQNTNHWYCPVKSSRWTAKQ